MTAALEEVATVVAVDGDFVLLEVERGGGCGACALKGSCGVSALSSAFGHRAVELRLRNTLGACAGEKVLLDRIEEKFREKGFSSAQYSSFDSVLGRPIHEYLNKYFFAELSDHLNLFMYLPKTPFIWHLSSGPEQGFDCYIIIYKWSRDKLMRLRSVYIEHRERSLVNRQSDLSGNESADAQNEKDLIFRQLKEIEAFKKKIDELLSEGYNPTLDDGVGKNIAPLQKKGLIPYEVLNAGQLKKYLNADW